MKTHIIAIHGLNNKPRKEILLEGWRRAIEEGLRRNESGKGIGAFDIEMVYWADLGYEKPLADDDVCHLYTPFPEDQRLPEYKAQWVDGLFTRGRETIGSTADNLGSLVPREIISDDMLRKRFPDLAKYYLDTERRSAVQQRLFEALSHQTAEKLVILSHSMGTIVAMDVLRACEKKAPQLQVNALITMGSPLGLPYVIYLQKQTFQKPAASPECVAQWMNFSDKGDHICADPHLADDYEPNSRGVRVVDDMIFNTHETNPHDAHGYLRCPEVSRFLASILEA